MAERLLDHYAAPLITASLGQPVLGELAADLVRSLRRDGEVKRVVAARAALLVQFLDGLAEPLERGVVVELSLYEADAFRELVPHETSSKGVREDVFTAASTSAAKSSLSHSRRTKPTSTKLDDKSPWFARS